MVSASFQHLESFVSLDKYAAPNSPTFLSRDFWQHIGTYNSGNFNQSRIMNRRGKISDHSFFFTMSMILFMIVFGGFSNHFFFRSFTERAPLPNYLTLHAIIFTLWYIAYIWQNWLASRGKIIQHKTNGRYWSLFAIAVVLSGIFVIYSTLKIYFESGDATFGVSGLFWGNNLILLTFSAYVILGYIYRNKPQNHKRFFLLASISMLGPALGRMGRHSFMRISEDFMINEAIYGLGGVFLLLLTLSIYDLYKSGKLYRATIIGLLWFFVSNVILFSIISSGLGNEIIENMR